MIYLLVAVGVICYLVVLGACLPTFRSKTGDSVDAVPCAIFWPLSLPVILGLWLVAPKKNKLPKAEVTKL